MSTTPPYVECDICHYMTQNPMAFDDGRSTEWKQACPTCVRLALRRYAAQLKREYAKKVAIR